MYYLGYDLGSSSVKVAIVNSETGEKLAALQEPEEEMAISSQHPDWAEQDPEMWWEYVCTATKRILEEFPLNKGTIKGIGISYQMHGLVVVDSNKKSLRNAIIWCDSRAIEIGNDAFRNIGEAVCSDHLLNSPGNFTASKLKWVKEYEPNIYKQIHKYMLPGDYIAMRLSGIINTTKNGLSEGILWDYKKDSVANWLLEYYDIDPTLTPDVIENFSVQATVDLQGSKETGIPEGTPILYRAGDQPNNALSLNIFNPGEVAVTGGTSGVIYNVSNTLKSKESSRINNFAHVNYSAKNRNIGKLLCINGAGIMYRWLRNNTNVSSYDDMNLKAAKVPIGAEGLVIIPFGNGAERMLNNTNLGTQIININLNKHHTGHLCRAALESVAFSFVYGMDILKGDNAQIKVIRAGNDNLFRSEIFSNTVATLIGHEIEIFNTTGSVGAARACGLKGGDFKKFGEVIAKNDHVMTFMPLQNKTPYELAYRNWKQKLESFLKHKNN